MKTSNSKVTKAGWKSAVMILSTALCVGAMAPRASAQGVPANRDINWGQVSAFDAYLDHHPAMAQQLSANPGLVRNEEYLERHPDLRNFLNTNPSVREELTETPGWFMQRESQYRTLERTNGGLNRVEMDNLDRYFDTHPGVARELAARPGLADNHEYLRQHQELREFLVRHPGVWSQFRAHPNWLMFREQRYRSHQDGTTAYRDHDRDDRNRDGDYRRRDWNDRDREANYRRSEIEHRDRREVAVRDVFRPLEPANVIRHRAQAQVHAHPIPRRQIAAGRCSRGRRRGPGRLTLQPRPAPRCGKASGPVASSKMTALSAA